MCWSHFSLKVLIELCQQVDFMWQDIDSVVPNVSILRRLLFAARHVSKECPNYWNIVADFAFGPCTSKQDVRLLIENLDFLDDKAFQTDKELMKELHTSQGYQHQPLGIVFISTNNTCRFCGGKLLIRADRPSFMTVYTDDIGTVHATHFRKYCQNSQKKCHYTQHYGFHTYGDSGDMIFDPDWDQQPYFLSTSKTAFSLSFLRKFEAEILLGQISYHQKSCIYNYYNNYEQVKKRASRTSSDHISDEDNPIDESR